MPGGEADGRRSLGPDVEDPGYEVIPRPARAPGDWTYDAPPPPPASREPISPVEVLLMVAILLVISGAGWWFIAGPGRGTLFAVPQQPPIAPTAPAGASPGPSIGLAPLP